MSNRAPQVSVVMPAFNAARTIRSAIESVLRQSFDAVEILVGDDASTDDTAAVVRRMDAPNVRLLSNERNLGPGLTRDALIREARGEWIAFFDADDLMHEDRLQRMVGVATHLPDCILFDDILLCHDTPDGLSPYKRLRGNARGPGTNAPRHVPLPDYLRQPKLMIHPIVRRTTIASRDVHHTSGRYGEDSNFFLTLAARGTPLFYLDEPLYLYRLTPGSATRNRQRQRLLREQIELVTSEPALSMRDKAAFESKIAALRREEAYDAFVSLLREGHYGQASREALSDVSLLLRFLRRGASDVYYHLHRRARSGRAR